jgi:hypothetical protein
MQVDGLWSSRKLGALGAQSEARESRSAVSFARTALSREIRRFGISALTVVFRARFSS